MLELLHELLLRPHEQLLKERPGEVRHHQLALVVAIDGLVDEGGEALPAVAGLVRLALLSLLTRL